MANPTQVTSGWEGDVALTALHLRQGLPLAVGNGRWATLSPLTVAEPDRDMAMSAS